MLDKLSRALCFVIYRYQHTSYPFLTEPSDKKKNNTESEYFTCMPTLIVQETRLLSETVHHCDLQVPSQFHSNLICNTPPRNILVWFLPFVLQSNIWNWMHQNRKNLVLIAIYIISLDDSISCLCHVTFVVYSIVLVDRYWHVQIFIDEHLMLKGWLMLADRWSSDSSQDI